MQIEEQIKKLQRIKAKIDLHRRLISNLKADSEAKDPEHKALEAEHPGLFEEFCKEIVDFSVDRIQTLSNPEAPKLPTATERIIYAEPETENQPVAPKPQAQPPMDPLKFLMANKHLEGKKISFKTKDGIITGTVRGISLPASLKVETDTGYDISIPPSEVTVLEEEKKI